MIKQPDLFLGFKRDNVKSHDKPEFEVGVHYDLAGEIDEANGWREPGEGDDAVTDELRKVAAKGINELMRFCIGDGMITKRGAMRSLVCKLVAVGQLISPENLSASWSHSNVPTRNRRPGPPLSLRDLARMLGVPTRDLRRLQAKFANQWGFKLHLAPRRNAR